MPTTDLKTILDALPTSNAVKAEAWDAVTNAASEQEFKSRLDRLPVPRETKAALWDTRQSIRAPQLEQQAIRESPAGETSDALGRFGEGVYETTLEPLINTALHPWDTTMGLTRQALGTDDLGAIRNDVGAGEYGRAGKRAAKWLIENIPGRIGRGIVEPVVEKVLGDNYAGAAGNALGILAGFAAPELGAKLELPVRLPGARPVNPKLSAALDYLESKGIPVSAADRSENGYIRNIQKSADSTPLGSIVAQYSQAAKTAGLRNEAGALLAEARPNIPADVHYGAFRAAEASPANIKSVVVGKEHSLAARTALDQESLARFNRGYGSLDSAQKGVVERNVRAAGVALTPEPVYENIALPVDVKGLKAQMKPLYEDISKWWEPAKRNASAGFQAMKSIMDGPDVVPASQAEAGLSGLKALAREADGRSAGVAKFVIPKLQELIDGAAAKGGPDVVSALQQGRKAAAAEVAVERLQKIFDKATAEGGFNREGGIWQDYQRQKPELTRMLSPRLIDNLDAFFLGAKRLAENPNPSGSAVVGISAATGTMVVRNPLLGVPVALGGYALAKVLHSPMGAKLLTQGMKMPLKGPSASLLASQILRVAGADAIFQRPVTAQ